jgi:hypothetical protein
VTVAHNWQPLTTHDEQTTPINRYPVKQTLHPLELQVWQPSEQIVQLLKVVLR